MNEIKIFEAYYRILDDVYSKGFVYVDDKKKELKCFFYPDEVYVEFVDKRIFFYLNFYDITTNTYDEVEEFVTVNPLSTDFIKYPQHGYMLTSTTTGENLEFGILDKVYNKDVLKSIQKKILES